MAVLIPLSHKIARFLCFMASQFVFLLAIGAVTRPEDEEMASAYDLFFGVLKLALRASIGTSSSPDSERALEASSLAARLQTSRDRALFVFLCSISGSLAISSLRWDSTYRLSSMEEVCRGASLGALYALLYLYSKRMILKFPVIQVTISLALTSPNHIFDNVSLSFPYFVFREKFSICNYTCWL
jgi:hypothetical protein